MPQRRSRLARLPGARRYRPVTFEGSFPPLARFPLPVRALLFSRAMYFAALLSIFVAGQPPSFARGAERGLSSVATLEAICEAEREQVPSWILELVGGDGERTTERERIHGAAVIISEEGLLITSRHLVVRAEKVQVRLADGRVLEATVVGSDAQTDIAVVRVDPGSVPLRPIEVGESSALAPGDFVLSIGDPFRLGRSVSLGVVSAKGKIDIGLVDPEELIQTDAAINPGSSGGALVDTEGRLIGINTAIVTNDGASRGVGFAVPVERALPIALSIVRDGRFVRGWLGVDLQDLDAALGEVFFVGAKGGVLVTEVTKDGPAEVAGLKREDVLISVDGAPVGTAAMLRDAIAQRAPGTPVMFEVRRLHSTKKISARIAASPAAKSDAASPVNVTAVSLGLHLSPIGDLRGLVALPEWVAHGAVVTELEAGGVAELAGVRAGDVIVELERRRMLDPSALETTWRESARPILIRIVRQGRSRYLALPAPPKEGRS